MLRVLGCRPNAEAVEAARQALVVIDMRLSSDLAKNVASVSTYMLVRQDELYLCLFVILSSAKCMAIAADAAAAATSEPLRIFISSVGDDF